MKIVQIVLILNLLLNFTGCSTATKQEETKGKTEAETLYKNSLQLIKDKRFILATEKLNSLKSQYPYSYYATHAELLLGDILFKQESFPEAGITYVLFKDFHPQYKDMNYVIWMIGESYFKQIPDSYDRDLSAAREAIKYYNELIRRFPAYEKVTQARERIKKSHWMLLQREKYIADFYFKTSVYKAARYRYLDILNNFEDDQLRVHAMLRVVKSSFNLEEYKKCLNYGDLYSEKLIGKQKEKLLNIINDCRGKI